MTAHNSYNASAPGSLMLLGEHAVLHRRPALVAAVNRRIKIKLTPREDRQVRITSALGRWQGALDGLEPTGPFRFVLAVLRSRLHNLPGGCDLRIRSDFSDRVGLASSAAVTVAAHAAIDAWLGRCPSPLARVVVARSTIRAVQGCGSGADAAAAVFGGLLYYRAEPLEIESLPCLPPVVLRYSGGKTPTPEVIRIVEQRAAQCPNLYETLYDSMAVTVHRAVGAARNNDLHMLGAMLNVGQGLMDAIGVNTPELAAIVFALRNRKTIYGAKISGSGLGDCAVGLGCLGRGAVLPGRAVPVTLSAEGVRCD